MTYWQAKNMGVGFGGVWDDDRDEETLESVFYNDLYVPSFPLPLSSPLFGGAADDGRYRHAYNLSHPGRWISMNLKKPKKKAGAGRRKAKVAQVVVAKADEAYHTDDEIEEEVILFVCFLREAVLNDRFFVLDGKDYSPPVMEEEDDPDDPQKTIPLTRYNTFVPLSFPPSF